MKKLLDMLSDFQENTTSTFQFKTLSDLSTVIFGPRPHHDGRSEGPDSRVERVDVHVVGDSLGQLLQWHVRTVENQNLGKP